VSVSIPNRVRKGQLPSSHSSQQPPSRSSHLNDRLHQARKASSTALGPSPLCFHHRLRRKVRGARNTAANMPAVQEAAYQPRPCPLTSFLSRPSISMSPCPISSPPPDQTSGSSAGTPTQGLAESSLFHTVKTAAMPGVRRRSFSGTTLPVTQHLQHSKRLFQKTCSPPVHHPLYHHRPATAESARTSPSTAT
jgi:hypothetical protein